MDDYRIFLNVFLSMEGPSERRHLRFSTWLGAETGLRKAGDPGRAWERQSYAPCRM